MDEAVLAETWKEIAFAIAKEQGGLRVLQGNRAMMEATRPVAFFPSRSRDFSYHHFRFQRSSRMSVRVGCPWYSTWKDNGAETR